MLLVYILRITTVLERLVSLLLKFLCCGKMSPGFYIQNEFPSFYTMAHGSSLSVCLLCAAAWKGFSSGSGLCEKKILQLFIHFS